MTFDVTRGGLPQLPIIGVRPQGVPEFPAGLPQLPGLPPLPGGVGQAPGGLPQLPGLPNLPQLPSGGAGQIPGGLPQLPGLPGMPQFPGSQHPQPPQYPQNPHAGGYGQQGGLGNILQLIMMLLCGGRTQMPQMPQYPQLPQYPQQPQQPQYPPIGAYPQIPTIPVPQPNYPTIPTMPTYPGGGGGGVYGDPHFSDPDNGDGKWHYDVMGQPGKTYNVLSDKDIQVNTLFKAYNGNDAATVMDKAGFTLNVNGKNHTVEVATDGSLLIDKTPVTENGAKSIGGENTGYVVTREGDKVIVETPTYKVNVGIAKNADAKLSHLNLGFNIKEDPFADRISPHGLWGISIDGIKTEGAATGAGAQGQGAIDRKDRFGGDVASYEVQDLFSIPTQHNRFGESQVGWINDGKNWFGTNANGQVVFVPAAGAIGTQGGAGG